MPSSVRRAITLTVSCGLVLLLSGAALAQSYTSTRLVSDLTGKAPHTDPLLKNPWGLAYAPGGAFWISDEASGWSTLYDGSGNPQSLQVIVPSSSGVGHGKPTGIVYNGSTEFKIMNWTSVFLFATLDGTISGWSAFEPTTALIGARQTGAKYTGLAITNHTSGNFLYAADIANNRVDMYDGSFNLVKSFTDTTLPAGFAPFGIQDIAGKLFVTFASQSGGSGGFVDMFKEDGTLVKRLIHGAPLNQPWGVALAPANFGPLSGALLISNNTSSGTINGFNHSTGALIGTVKNASGNPIKINGLWGIEFGGGSALNGRKNQLFYTAGPSDKDGFFGVINSH
jgi:uncharacterized protein (TIGR03118 family)